MSEPETRYARAGELHVAFQVTGEDTGLDIVVMPHWATHVELMWDDPPTARLLRRIESLGRLVRFDRRGTGLSDPVVASELPTLETWAEDLDAVLDAVASRQCAIVACDTAAFVAVVYAASRPERVHSLVLVNATARVRRDEDYPEGLSEHVLETLIGAVEQNWGRDWIAAPTSNPSVAADPDARAFSVRYARASASPGVMLAMTKMLIATDVRAVLPLVRARTLVLHRRDDRYIPATHGLYIAAHIAGATFVELEGADHDIENGDVNALLSEIERFLVGRPGSEPTRRALATVLFTDIVGSTELLATRGDHAWRVALDRHDDVVRRQVQRFNGREISTSGDGFLILFDGPASAVRCALAIRNALQAIDIEVRAGLHTGEVDLTGNDISGIAVHIASRISTLAEAGEVLVSRTIVDLTAGSGIEFIDRGEHTLKGVPDAWRLFLVENA